MEIKLLLLLLKAMVIKKFVIVRGDIIKNERLTDIELDTIEAWVTLAKLMGFDYDLSEAYEEQTP